VGVSLSASPPKFPTEFQTMFLFVSIDNRTENDGEWSFSAKHNSEKWYHIFPDHRTVVLRRYDLKKGYVIERVNGRNPECHAHSLTGNLPVMSFDGWNFTGSFIHDGRTVDSWKEPIQKNPTRYFDFVKTEIGNYIPFELLNDHFRMKFVNYYPMTPPSSYFDVPSICK